MVSLFASPAAPVGTTTTAPEDGLAVDRWSPTSRRSTGLEGLPGGGSPRARPVSASCPGVTESVPPCLVAAFPAGNSVATELPGVAIADEGTTHGPSRN